MPGRKVARTEAEVPIDGQFRWTPANDRMLLLLSQGRSMSLEECRLIATAIPGTNQQGVAQRVRKLRAEQRKLYEQFGWELPANVKPATKRKKKVEDRAGTDDDEQDTKPKKLKSGKKLDASEDTPLTKGELL